MRFRTLFPIACLMLFLGSCATSHYKVKSISSTRLAVDNSLEAIKDADAEELIAPFRRMKDSIMSDVIGQAEVSMVRGRPENALGNLIADVLRSSASRVLGHQADVALMNMGGMRTDLAKGDITVSNVYEILPFENSLCVLTIKGSDLKKLFANIAARKGEAISGARIVISQSGKLLDCKVGGQDVDDDKVYSLSTIDYLAEGNDGMTAITSALTKQLPSDAILRDIFMQYVKDCAKEGKSLYSSVEGRVTLKEN